MHVVTLISKYDAVCGVFISPVIMPSDGACARPRHVKALNCWSGNIISLAEGYNA